MADIDDKLAAALKEARRTPMNFVFVAKGTSQGKLVVSKKPIASKDVAAAKKETGGGVVFRGRCVGEEGKLIFETAKEPPTTLAKQLKTIITRDVGLTNKVETRAAADLVDDGDGEAPAPAVSQAEAGETDGPPAAAPAGQAAPTSAAPAPAAPQPSADLKTAVTKRLAALAGPYKEAVAQKGADIAQMQSFFASFKGFVSAHDYERAAKVLDELEPLVAQFKTREADFKVRKGEVQAAMTKVVGWGKDAGLYKTAIQAADKLEKTNVAEALATLDKAKGDAEADVKSADDEYQELKKSVTSKADKLRDPKVWDHVKADLEPLPKLEDADAQVQAGKGAAGRKIMEGLVAPYAQAVVNVQAYQGVLTKQGETDKRIADLEKDANMAAHLAPQIADAKSKVEAAVKLADPPGRDYAGALNALAVVDRDCGAAQKMTQDYQRVLSKKAESDNKIAAVEKLPLAANIAPEIAVSKTKVANALKLADPPGHDYAGSLAAMVAVDAACVTMQKMTEDYQKVLNLKSDTDKKIARLESHPQKALIAADIVAIKSQEAAALALAVPPGHDYVGASNAIGAVDKSCAAAEIKIMDKAVTGMDRGDMRKLMKKTFKERFGIELDMEAKGDTPSVEYEAVRRVYELMAMVPESHTNNNPSIKKIERIGGHGGAANEVSYYEPTTDIFLGLGTKASKKVVLHCGRPAAGGTTLQRGLINPATGSPDPPVDADCQPKPGASTSQSYFDWTTLHEIAHGIDDKQGFMKAHADFGGWVEYGSDCSAAAQAAAAQFNFNTPDAIEYIRKLMEGKEGNRPGKKPAAPKGRADWDAVRQNVEKWCDSIRVGKEPWDNMPADIGGRIYHEAYEKNWVSYLKAKRSQAITGYQFRAPGEWFSELYAAYHSGVLKDSHPMVKKFLKDL